MYIEFTGDLITGNPLIDSQHEELISRLNQLLICNEDQSAKEEAERLLQFLVEYAEFHFDAEEKLQEDVGYPGLPEHKKEHDKLRHIVGDLQVVLDEGDCLSDVFVEMCKKELIDWVDYHIRGYDRSVAEFIFMAENTDRL